MYKDKFIMSVMYDGHPVREYGPSHDKKVILPFNSEYKIRLKNKNSTGCTARVFIDGTPISNFGDFIIDSGASIDIERFVSESLKKGAKFKFVALDHKDVNDPTSSDNGVIRVEFRMAKYNVVRLDTISPTTTVYPPASPWEIKKFAPDTPMFWESGDSTGIGKWDVHWRYNSSADIKGINSVNTPTVYCYNTIQGATVEGGVSGQAFSSGYLDVEETPSVVLKLKIVGSADTPISKAKNYCTKCGNALSYKDKYCSKCGRRI